MRIKPLKADKIKLLCQDAGQNYNTRHTWKIFWIAREKLKWWNILVSTWKEHVLLAL